MMEGDPAGNHGAAAYGGRAEPIRLAVLSESPADEAAVRVLAEFTLKQPVALVAPTLRARGWPSVEQVLPAVLRHLYFRTRADGLVVVVDSDDSVVHTPDHDAPGHHHPYCRLCRLRAAFRRTQKNLPPRPGAAAGNGRVLRGAGLAVPAIEAWYLCGSNEGVTEDAWIAGQENGRQPYTRRDLKRLVYGTERPSLPLEMKIAVREVTRHRGDIRRLENDFPRGFGSLARDLREWGRVEKDEGTEGQRD